MTECVIIVGVTGHSAKLAIWADSALVTEAVVVCPVVTVDSCEEAGDS